MTQPLAWLPSLSFCFQIFFSCTDFPSDIAFKFKHSVSYIERQTVVWHRPAFCKNQFLFSFFLIFKVNGLDWYRIANSNKPLCGFKRTCQNITSMPKLTFCWFVLNHSSKTNISKRTDTGNHIICSWHVSQRKKISSASCWRWLSLCTSFWWLQMFNIYWCTSR